MEKQTEYRMPRKHKTPIQKTSAYKKTRAAKKNVQTPNLTPRQIQYSSQSSQDSQPEQNTAKNKKMSETNGVRVPFPPFKTDDIEAWFRRVEHWFTFNKVTTEIDKFALIASQIEDPTVSNSDEMLKPSAEKPYSDLKAKIITIFEATTTAKINKWLSGCQLGDMKPSQLLAEMKRMGGNVGDEILRNLWSKRLPLHVQTVVAAATQSTLDQVSLIADAVIDVVPTSSASVNQTTNNNPANFNCEQQKQTEIDELRMAVNELTKSFNKMQSSNRSRSHSRSNQNNRDRSTSNSGQVKLREDRICRYHRKFGSEAYLCTKPCSFSTDDQNSKN